MINITPILAAQYAPSREGIALLDRQIFDTVLASRFRYCPTVLPKDLSDRTIATFRVQHFGRPAEPRPALRAVQAVS